MLRDKLRSSARKNSGFTLVEVVVIAPILILTLGGFIFALVTMVGDAMSTRDANNLVFGSQEALDRIEQDVRLATGFQASTGTLPSPQGQNSNYAGTSSFTASSSNHLIMSVPATTANPLDNSREIVYYANQPQPCGANQKYNTPFTVTVIYYVYNNSLYRRTVVPTFTLASGANQVCATPWQQDSCSPGYTNTTECKTQDVKLTDNVSSLAIAYYSSPDSNTPLVDGTGNPTPQAGTTVDVTINTSKTSAGQPLAHNSTVRATRINSTVAATSVPLAFTTHPNNVYAVIADTNITFTAQAPYNPTYTWQRSTDNGATWTTISGATNSTYTIPSVSMSMNQYKYRAIALDQYGRTMTSNPATLTVSIWGPVTYENNWGIYDASGVYPGAHYTKTSAGLVMLKGLVAGGAPTWDTNIATLPVGYRPASRMIFYVGSWRNVTNSNSGFGRVDVLPTGEVRFMSGTSTWISLDSIRFLASGTACSISTNLTLANGWVNYGAPYAPLSLCRDSTGRINQYGLVRSGNSALGMAIGTIPAGYQSSETLIVPAADTTPEFGSIGIASGSVTARGMLTSFLSTNNLYIANNGAVTWNTPTVANGMTYWGTPYATLQYGKTSDNVVMIKGLLKGGTVADGTTVFTLPSGYRPAERRLFSSVANQHHARIDVLPDGRVMLQGDADTGWTSFDAINFLADGN